MFSRLLSIICFLVIVSSPASAQLGKIPVAVTAAFAKQYPGAQQVSYADKFSEFRVHFHTDSLEMIAKYNAKGEWRGSERNVAFESLSADVRDGLAKSKYADYKVLQASILYLAATEGGGEQYRIKVHKKGNPKKLLYFNRQGRLVRDTVVL